MFSFFTACVIGVSSVNAAAQNFPADVVTKGTDGEFQGKMYMQDGNVRMEMAEAVTITRPDKKVVWVLMPAQQMYMEQSITSRDFIVSKSAGKSGEVDRKLLGTDMVGGKTMNKFQVTYSGEGSTMIVYEWMDSGFDMPVKIAAIDGSWSMEYRNIKIGAQALTFSEIPAGYQKFAMPDMATMMAGNN